MKIKELTSMKQGLKIEPPQKKLYIMYCRKSSEAEDRQVQSIDDQIRALREIVSFKNLEVKKVLSESISAKAPGRPKFNELVNIIDTQNVKGILCWKLNRLFRNPEDEGKIRQRLSDGRILEIVTPGKTYLEVDSDFTMAVEGAQGQRFIKDLREDTKRGLDSKIEKGMAPLLAPPGYINNTYKRQGEKDISNHPVYFTLMRKIFELALTGNFSINSLSKKAEELGIKNSRGKPISKTQMSVMLKNPFYTGRFIYGGKMHQGIHQQMLTDEEFDLLQDIIAGRSRPRKIKHDFALNGLIRCGECEMMITGEDHKKTYKNGKKQIFSYYRCTKKNKTKICKQSYTSSKELELQVLQFLEEIKLSTKFVDWAIKWLNETNKEQKGVREASYKALKSSYDEVVARMDNLLDLKLSPLNEGGNLISNEEFISKKQDLMAQKEGLREQLSKIDKHIDEWTELSSKTFDFASTARDRFEKGTLEDKKIILRAVGSNLILKDKKLSVQPRAPFLLIQKAVREIVTAKTLEPNEKVGLTGYSENLQKQNTIMGG